MTDHLTTTIPLPPLNPQQVLDQPDKKFRSPLAEKIIRRHRELRQRSAEFQEGSSPGVGPASLASGGRLLEAATPSPAISKPVTVIELQRSADTDPDLDAKIRKDFKVFLFLIWNHLGLPDPTPIQLSMADYLQHGPRSSVIMGFRGVAKSWITGAFALWTIYCNPQRKVMVVSGSMKRAVQQTTWCLALIRDMPLLTFLEPGVRQRQSTTAFDVGPARPAQSSSFSAFGITGQIVGQRADLIIADDVETNTNSMTVMMRSKLADAIKEFDAILVPGGKVKFLGTPQTHDSIYNKLPARGYEVRIWSLVYPDEDRIKRYGVKLSPYILNRALGHAGESTEPSRFPMDEIERLRLSWGTSGFDLQFMLDTSLTDANKFPLKLRNLIVMSLPIDKGPDDVVWGNGEDEQISHLPEVGFAGDHYFKPQAVTSGFTPWESTVGIIDPSGEGEDETALGIGSSLHGRVFLRYAKGWLGGSSPSTLLDIAHACVKYGVGTLKIESNFGGNMFGQLLRPVLTQVWEEWNKQHPNEHGGTSIEDERAARVQKELRIIDDMEPATQSHRVVIAQELIQSDYDDVLGRDGHEDTKQCYSVMWQYANLTKERNSLTHDDRIETLAGVVAHYRSILGVNPDMLSADREEERLQAELDKLFGDADEVHGIKPGRPVGRLTHIDPRSRR